MITATLYFRENSPECEQVKADLEALQANYPHQLISIDVNDPAERENSQNYQNTPVVLIGPYRLDGEITRARLQVALGAASDRRNQLERVDQKSYQDRLNKGRTVSGGDRASLWISKYYIHVFNVLMFLYVGIPFLAPVLMKNGDVAPATVIYRFYSVMCHQLPFRSWFLYGEQAYYPRALAGIQGVITYEAISNHQALDVFNDRAFVGNDVVGFKVAFCERDVAIYFSLLLFGLVFAASGRKLRGIPWYIWVVVGLIPIALDGFSQLFDLIPGMPAWLPMRESTPFLRTLTGGLFGLMSAWYLYPMIEETMRETRRLISHKLAAVTQLGPIVKD